MRWLAEYVWWMLTADKRPGEIFWTRAERAQMIARHATEPR